MRKIDAIVLAAGSSRRMPKENKLLLKTGDTTMIHRVVSAVSASEAQRVIVVVGHEHDQVIDALGDIEGVQFIYNSAHKRGQSFSIKSAMSQLSADAEGFMICLGDMPMITSEDYNEIIKAYSDMLSSIDYPIVRPIYKGSIGHPVIFHSAYKQQILQLPADADARVVIQNNKENYTEVEVNSINHFFDVDNMMDYQRLVRFLEN